MDLGIAGKSAIICASSQGLGKACALALAEEGVRVYINGRDLKKLKLIAMVVLFLNWLYFLQTYPF